MNVRLSFINPKRNTICYQESTYSRLFNGLLTEIRTRTWLQTVPEPGTWNVDLISSTPLLQNQSGGFAVDLYNASGSAAVYIDEIEITDPDI